MTANFEHPTIDWDKADLCTEFTRFQNHVEFVFAGPLAEQSDKQKAGWLGTWIGCTGREIYKTFQWQDGEKDNPTTVLKKFENYVKPRKNKRIARHKLKNRKFAPNEPFDMYLKDIRLLIMDCGYDNPDDILIDIIIDNHYDKKVQERLLSTGEDKLTLAKAIEICQQRELSLQQMKIVRDEDTSVSALAQRHKYGRGTKPKTSKTKEYAPKTQHARPQNKHFGTKSKTCQSCGKDAAHSWNKGVCPAKGSTCSYCKKPNHWLAVCRNRTKANALYVSERSAPEMEDNEVFHIHAVKDIKTVNTDIWTTDLVILQKRVRFRIDTGARCNTLTSQSYQQLHHTGELERSKKVLRSYSNHHITPKATVLLEISHQSESVKTSFEIVDVMQENVLSGDTAAALGLITRILSVNTTEQTQHDEDHKILQEFPELVRTTGTLPGTYTIKIEPGAKGVVHAARRQPAALKKRIIDKLHEMEENGYIQKVQEPTEWVSSMVAAVKKDKIRICIDPSDLNRVIKREHYPMRTIEEVVSEIPGATVFSVLDAKSGFLQIKLDPKSQLLTTFNTPIGRYKWLRLPFGLKCAPEIYQRIMDQMLENIPGARAIMDDILVAGRDTEHHDKILKQVIERATTYNLKLNMQKCMVRQSQVPYIGHMMTSTGLKPDPSKVTAVRDMPAPTDKDGVRRFLGLVTYLSKFVPNLSEIDSPLRELLKSDAQFQWQPSQIESFNKLKQLCCTPPVLAFYDVKKTVEIHCDASQHGLGAVLIQDGHPIAFSSRALTDAETRYAQIEKEMLSIVHACVKFHNYIFGKETTVFNDHKPLEQIFRKPLLAAPMRLQKMRLKLQWYDLNVQYRRGKEMYVPDTLSRAHLPESASEVDNLEHVSMLDYLSVTKQKYAEIQDLTQRELCQLQSVIINGWPDTRQELPVAVRPYWDSRSELTVSDSVIYKGLRIVVPPGLRQHMLKLIHQSHLGIVKCKQRARETLYWPSMNTDVEQTVKNCCKCAEFQNKLPQEPLKPTATPELPFSEVGTDIFEHDGKHYIVLIDYYSKFIEVDKLPDLRSTSTISVLKSQFSRHGIPQILRSDNGPQYSSKDFSLFCDELSILHKTSSPHTPHSNGAAEKAVQIVKRLWKKGDKDIALLDYRTTPLEDVNLSPAQLLMGRRPRNLLPASSKLLAPTAFNHQEVKRRLNHQKVTQKYYHDTKASTDLRPFVSGESVRIAPYPGNKKWTPGVIVDHHTSPRSYVVKTPQQVLLRRNRQDLRPTTETANSTAESDMPMPEPTSPSKSTSPMDPPKESSTAQATESSQSCTSAPDNTAVRFEVTTSSGRVVKPRKILDL